MFLRCPKPPVIAGVLLLAGSLWAASTVVPPAPPSSGSAGAASHLPPEPPPPLPPRTPTAVETFRRLICMAPAQREEVLTTRSEKQRTYLRARLAEFDALSPAEREIRLRLIELRAALMPLLLAAPGDRAKLLRQVPDVQRELVEAQLRVWDELPAARREQLLARRADGPAFAPLPPDPPVELRPPTTASAAAARRSRGEEGLAVWRSLSVEQQSRATQQLTRLLALPPRQQEAVMAALPEAQRASVTRMVASLGRLSVVDRERCLASFQRFAAMSPAQRHRFWANVDRWETLAPEERRAWRTFTATLPPSPPGLQSPPPPPPPRGASSAVLPPGAQAAR